MSGLAFALCFGGVAIFFYLLGVFHGAQVRRKQDSVAVK